MRIIEVTRVEEAAEDKDNSAAMPDDRRYVVNSLIYRDTIIIESSENLIGGYVRSETSSKKRVDNLKTLGDFLDAEDYKYSAIVIPIAMIELGIIDKTQFRCRYNYSDEHVMISFPTADYRNFAIRNKQFESSMYIVYYDKWKMAEEIFFNARSYNHMQLVNIASILYTRTIDDKRLVDFMKENFGCSSVGFIEHRLDNNIDIITFNE